MKAVQIVFAIFLLILTVSCKQQNTEVNEDNQIERNIILDDSASSIDLVQIQDVEPKETYYQYLYASFSDGAPYFDSPQGEELGVYPLNTRLKVIQPSSIIDSTYLGKEMINGSWLGVEKGKDTVYVFNAFLSDHYTVSDFKLYRASGPYSSPENDDNRIAFLNLSETYLRNPASIIKSGETRDTIRLNEDERKTLLKACGISDSDKVFIYEYEEDTVYTLELKTLPAISCVNIYAFGDYGKEEYDFEFGFDLGESYNREYGNFTYVGPENPFETGKLHPVLWKNTTQEALNFDLKGINHTLNSSFLTSEKVYTYSLNELKYYFLDEMRMLVINTQKKSLVFSHSFHDGEGVSLTPIRMENDSDLEKYQWAGTLLKNQPNVIFGFQFFSFGCETINFLDSTHPPIEALCDNRH